MHQRGIGLSKDYTLAKRYYDLAIEYSPQEAFIPSYLSLWYLAIEQTLEYFKGEYNNLVVEGKDGEERRAAFLGI
jgi:SEL1 protein